MEYIRRFSSALSFEKLIESTLAAYLLGGLMVASVFIGALVIDTAWGNTNIEEFWDITKTGLLATIGLAFTMTAISKLVDRHRK